MTKSNQRTGVAVWSLVGTLSCGIALTSACLSNAAEFFVAPDGIDSNAGTKARPFASLERARDEVRKLAPAERSAVGGITIWLRGGDYWRTNSFELTPPDAGTSAAPITWRAFSRETVRILGGRRLTGFRPITDPEILNRLAPEARNHAQQINLKSLGISDYGEMQSRGFGRPGRAAHCELFFNGKPMTLARWPNEGTFEQIAGFPQTTAENDGHGGSIGKLQDGFYYAGDRPRGWQNPDEVWVHGYWSWDWANSYERVAAIDLDQRLIKTAAPYGQYGFRKGQRFYFLNVLEELDEPGEWFLDRKSGMLYFWPPAATVAATSPPNQSAALENVSASPHPATDPEILLSTLAQPLLKLTDVSYVTFRGLMLGATRADAIEIRGGVSNRISGCLIRDIGDTGITIAGGQGHGVLSCDIFDTGDGGVSLEGGDRQTLTSAGHFVENCRFARQGRWSKCYVPAIHMGGVGQRASHNLIHDHPHCAILFSGNDHLIEFNEIHHVALETGDVGAIYTGRDYTFRGNRIRYNFIHDTGGVGMGSMGVYMDDCVSGTEIYGNIFYKVQRAAFLGGGRDHQVINNIFVDCNHAVELDGRGLDPSPVWRQMVDETMRQSLRAVPSTLYRARYPAMISLDSYYGPPDGPAIEGAAFKGVPPDNNVVARNLCVGKWLNAGWHAKPEMLSLENNVTNAELCFAAAPGEHSQATDFALNASCPAWKTGFQKIPVERIGLYRDGFRTGSLSGPTEDQPQKP